MLVLSGSDLLGLFLLLSSLLGHQDGIGGVDAKKQPYFLCSRCSGFDFPQAVVLLFVPEAALQPGSPFLIEYRFHLLGRLIVFAPSLSYKVVEDAFPGSKSAVLIGRIDGVCGQVRALTKKKLVL